jgi:hypothetical protein
MAKFGSVANLVGLEMGMTGADAIEIKTWWEQGNQPEPEQMLGIALVDFDCPQKLNQKWAALPTMRWYQPLIWESNVFIKDHVFLALPPDTPAHCVGIQLAIVDAEEQPVWIEAIELESMGRWQMVTRDERVIISLVDSAH